MGFFSFLKDAGAKIFSSNPTPEEKATSIREHLAGYGFEGVDVSVEDETVTVKGEVDSLEIKNKILVAAGNVEGISDVNDELAVNEPVVVEVEPAKMFHVVKPGESLSAISKQVYGDPMQYNVIFEANKPMLEHPDKIYPGQVLVIPQMG